MPGSYPSDRHLVPASRVTLFVGLIVGPPCE